MTRWFLFVAVSSMLALNAVADPIFFQAHRGGMKEVPENTMSAYRYAWELGGIPEVDVCTTADGVIICLHDSTLKRTTDARIVQDTPVSKLKLEEIKKWDAGRWFDKAYTGERIPVLEEVFQAMKENPGYRIYIDLKNIDFKALAKLIHQYDVAERIIFCHNKVSSCKRIRKEVPEIQTMLWIGGSLQEIQGSYKAVAKTGFKGLNQVQLHLKEQDKGATPVAYQMPEDFLKQALAETQAAGVDLQVLPFHFDCDSLGALLDLGIRWYATDEPKRFLTCVKAHSQS